MKTKIIYFIVSIVLFSSCKKSSIDMTSPKENKVEFSKQEIDSIIKKSLVEKNHFEWQDAPDKMISNALEFSDHMLAVGYTINGFNDFDKRIADVNINNEEWIHARQSIISVVLNAERKLNPNISISDIMPWNEKVLPVLDFIISNPETVSLLRHHPLVRYAEPLGYEISFHSFEMTKSTEPQNATSSGSGCGSNTATLGLVANMDYVNISPSAKQSWNYIYHNIPRAWSKTTGAGTKVFFIDTGCEFDQENLGTAFNQGSSSGRTIEKIVTLPQDTFLGFPIGSAETPDDGCGHGTAMAGVCGAPRGIDGNSCGVAYNCNLVTCRAAANVFLDESREVKGVADAFTNAANRTDVKIISMSMGRITSSSQIADAVRYAYGKGKLIFCAAGTSFSWTSGWAGVIFPGSMPEVNAVTGVRDNSSITTCTDCHSGIETDFTIVMERFMDYQKPLSLAMSGDIPSTIGGSSVATATAAGIAALVCSRFPTYTRDQILNKLIQTSVNYPNRNANLGWGNLNADAATN